VHSVSPFFARARLLNVVDDLAKVVAALKLVLDLTEDLADLVFDSVRAGRLLPEAMQMGEELSVHEVPEIIAGGGLVVVEIAVFSLGRGPNSQLIRLVASSLLLSCSRSSRYFRRSSQEACSV
jgi:hypothetical protein